MERRLEKRVRGELGCEALASGPLAEQVNRGLGNTEIGAGGVQGGDPGREVGEEVW